MADDKTQESPLQSAMREAGVGTLEELQAKQASQRSGEPVAATGRKPRAATAEPKPAVEAPALTPISQDGSPLAQAAEKAGVGTVEELQAKQAAARAAAVPAQPEAQALNELVADPSLEGMDLAELAAEIRKHEVEHEVLSGKVARAQQRINEVRAHIDNLRARYTAATTVPNTVANQDYLEASKRAMQDRFKTALAAREALNSLDPQLQLDKEALGLGKSPLDRAISGQLTAKRRAESAAVQQATARKS